MANTRLGVTSVAFSLYFWGAFWGIFWELLHAVPALDTLAYRISLVFGDHFLGVAFPK